MRRAETEAQFQGAVIDLAATLGWTWYHTHDSRRSPSGFPDLVLTRERVIYVEFKAASGTPTVAQLEWMVRLGAAHAEVYLWRPRDLDSGAVLEVLKRKSPASRS